MCVKVGTKLEGIVVAEEWIIEEGCVGDVKCDMIFPNSRRMIPISRRMIPISRRMIPISDDLDH